MLLHQSLQHIVVFSFLWMRWVFVAARGLSLVAAGGGYSSLRCEGFSLRWLLLSRSMGSRHTGFSSCGTWAQQLWLVGSRAQAQQLWRMGLVAPRHVGSSQTRALIHVPCIGWILNHCATREAPNILYFDSQTSFFYFLSVLCIQLHLYIDKVKEKNKQ